MLAFRELKLVMILYGLAQLVMIYFAQLVMILYVLDLNVTNLLTEPYAFYYFANCIL